MPEMPGAPRGRPACGTPCVNGSLHPTGPTDCELRGRHSFSLHLRRGTVLSGRKLKRKAQCPMTFDDTMTESEQPRLAVVLRLVMEHLDSGSVVALTPAEMRLAHRLEGALAAFDVSSSVWSEPLVAGEAS